MAATEGTKVSKQGVTTHIKEFKKQCDLIGALAKMPGLLGTPLEAVRLYHDKVVDAEVAKLRKDFTPTFEIEGESGPSKDEVLQGGRMRKQAGGKQDVKTESPTKGDGEVPAGKKPAVRRSGGTIALVPR